MTRWVSGCGAALPRGQGVGPTLPPALPHVLGPPSSPVSRVVYNGKRNSSPRSPPSSSEIFTPAHEENVRFIYEGTRDTASRELSRTPLLPFRDTGSPLAFRGPAAGVIGDLSGEETRSL